MTDTLRTLTDRSEIAELVSRLGRWLDEQRWDEASSILTDDATAETPGGSARGRESVVAQARRNHTETTQHLITNCVMDLDGDRATIGANLLVTFAAPGEPGVPRAQLGERYRFEARRTPEGWRLSTVQVRPLWRSSET